jgi:hypothetical protein
MRELLQWRRWTTVFAPLMVGASVSGCVVADGPARLYTVAEETQMIRDNIAQINIVQYSSLDEVSRRRLRNDWIAARMYAIDIAYTPYEAALTKERQAVGFGAATSTLALTTAAGLVTPVVTKNVLTGAAGVITGARAAYDSDVLLAHSVTWIQSQMEATRANLSRRILDGMKLSTTDYPLAQALSDLEAYYRAGTFTGGLLSTSQIVAADAQNMNDGLDPVVIPPVVVVPANPGQRGGGGGQQQATNQQQDTAKVAALKKDFVATNKSLAGLQAQLAAMPSALKVAEDNRTALVAAKKDTTLQDAAIASIKTQISTTLPSQIAAAQTKLQNLQQQAAVLGTTLQ